jgi:hypothetical protein
VAPEVAVSTLWSLIREEELTSLVKSSFGFSVEGNVKGLTVKLYIYIYVNKVATAAR